MSLQEYKQKRQFHKTREPQGLLGKKRGRIFVIQKHYASHLHYDFRIELDGVLKSWAVPKGPPTNPKDRRLAVEVEDHPIEYAKFEGTIPKGEYGAGKVEIWDTGTWSTDGDPHFQLKKGHLEFELKGKKLAGRWMLVRTNMKAKKANWLLIKRTDATPAKEIEAESPEVPLETLKKVKMPSFIEPQLCTLVSTAPATTNWIHEIKFDGYRTFSRKENSYVKMLTRSGHDWSAKYKPIANDCEKLKAKSFLIDGEVVWIDDKGVTHFNGLQNNLENRQSDELAFYVFDLLFLDGKDLRDLPLLQRKKLLAALIEKSKTKKIIYSEHQTSTGPSVFKSACQLGLEGIVSKRADSPYLSGRGPGWVKTKCTKVQEFVICGHTFQDNGTTLAALLLGEHTSKNNLQYVGRVGTGFNQENLPNLMKKMKAQYTEDSPFSEKIPQSKSVQWLKPKLVANVEFGAWTEDHILRHAAFKGLRDDKSTKEIKTEKFVPTQEIEKGTQISHPEKIIFPKHQIKKIDIVNYYRAIELFIMPHIKNRPLSLLRCPQGQGKGCFFNKHLDSTDAIITVQNIEELIHLIQINSLELHAWGCHANAIKNPDLIVFDLDPDPTVGWKEVKKAATDLKDLLDQLQLKSFLKVSGNKGLHIHVPITPKYSWDEIKNFAKSVCMKLVEQNPEAYTVNILKKNRKNRIFLDYLRNGEGATAIVPFSVRNNPDATIALPISWDDLKFLKGPNLYTLKNYSKKFSPKYDPWKDYFKAKQVLKILDQARKQK